MEVTEEVEVVLEEEVVAEESEEEEAVSSVVLVGTVVTLVAVMSPDVAEGVFSSTNRQNFSSIKVPEKVTWFSPFSCFLRADLERIHLSHTQHRMQP